MAWIESHQKLKDDPKMLELCFKMGWSVDEAIGKLHRFWWWCVDHCEDGDLRRFSDNHIAHSMGVAVENAKVLVEAMVTCGSPDKGFLERSPYFRVVNWWTYMQKFLHSRHGKTNPDRISQIKALYSTTTVESRVVNTLTVPTNQPNPTNLTLQCPADGEEEKGNYHRDTRTALWFLNEASGSKFREVDSNLKIISARLSEPGVDLAGVKLMIGRQAAEWTGTEFEKFLRPETLFGKSKFDGYYAQREKGSSKKPIVKKEQISIREFKP